MKMNMVFKRLKGIALVWAAAIAVSACSSAGGGGDGGTVKLTMTAWGNPAEIQVYQRAIDAYQEVNPNVQVELIPAPGDTYKQKLLTQLQGGASPDVFYVGGEYMAQLITTGKVAELSEFMNSEASYAKPEEFVEGLWGAARVDGKVYGIPVDSNPMLLYYNKKVLEEAGFAPDEPQKRFEAGEWNWDTFAEITAKIKDSGKYGFVAENSALSLFSWIWTNGGEMYDEEGNIILDQNEKAQEAIRYLSENVKAGNFVYGGQLPKGQGPEAMLLSNQTGFVGAGRWLTPLFSQTEGLEFDYIPWPSNTENRIERAAVATAYLSATTDSKHLEEAMKFVSFYTSTQGQRARLLDNGNAIPSIHGIDEVVEQASIPEHAGYLIDARDAGKVEDQQSVVPGLDDEVRAILDLMYLGQISVDEAIDQVVAKAAQMIEEYRAGQ